MIKLRENTKMRQTREFFRQNLLRPHIYRIFHLTYKTVNVKIPIKIKFLLRQTFISIIDRYMIYKICLKLTVYGKESEIDDTEQITTTTKRRVFWYRENVFLHITESD